jgi:predicted nucleotidyltransferase
VVSWVGVDVLLQDGERIYFTVKGLVHMKRTNDAKAMYFSRRIRKNVSGVKRVILFGSRARGDAREGSDYDFAVIVRKKNERAMQGVRGTEVAFLNKFDTLSSSIVLDECEWEKHRNLPIGINILREGVWL